MKQVVSHAPSDFDMRPISRSIHGTTAIAASEAGSGWWLAGQLRDNFQIHATIGNRGRDPPFL